MDVQPFSLQQATILDSPDNFAFFTETAKITTLVMGPSGINVDFTKKNGPDRWPDIFPPGFSGPIQYCLGMAWKIDGRWYASAPIEMWNERLEGGGPPQDYALNWFYNPDPLGADDVPSAASPARRSPSSSSPATCAASTATRSSRSARTSCWCRCLTAAARPTRSARACCRFAASHTCRPVPIRAVAGRRWATAPSPHLTLDERSR